MKIIINNKSDFDNVLVLSIAADYYQKYINNQDIKRPDQTDIEYTFKGVDGKLNLYTIFNKKSLTIIAY